MLRTPVYVGRHPAMVCGPAIIFFPCRDHLMACGLTGIVCFKTETTDTAEARISRLEQLIEKIGARGYDACAKIGRPLNTDYLAGDAAADDAVAMVGNLKSTELFTAIFTSKILQARLSAASAAIRQLIDAETAARHVGGSE